MAEQTDSKTRQQNQQAYRQYQQKLAAKQQQVEQYKRLQETHRDTFDALDDLRNKRYGVFTDESGKLTQHPDNIAKHIDPTALTAGQKKLKKASAIHGQLSMYGGMVGMPFLARDSMIGTSMAGIQADPSSKLGKMALEARDYKFNQRLQRYQSSLNMSKDEAAIAAGKMGNVDTSGMSSSEIATMAKERFIARRFSAMNESEAGRFAVTKAQISADTSGKTFDDVATGLTGGNAPIGSGSSEGFFNIPSPVDIMKRVTGFGTPTPKPRTISENSIYQQGMESFKPGGMGALGNTLYGDAGTGMLGKGVGVAATALPLMPMVSSGLSSARNFESLKRLKDQRATSGTSGKIAEVGGTMSGLTKTMLSAPAATALAASTLPGAAGSMAHGAFQNIKDSAFGLTGGIGSKILGEGITSKLAAKTIEGGFLGSMASIAPNIVGGLGMALPGIVGGIAKGVSENKQRQLHGVRPTTNKLIKKYSRTVGRIDSLIRKMAMSGDIPSDRALELTLLTYIEQGISGLVGHTEASDSEKKLDTAASNAAVFGAADKIDNGPSEKWFNIGAKVSRGARGMLNRTQELSHAFNIPGQVMDLLFHGKTPGARKREFAAERNRIFTEREGDKFARDKGAQIRRPPSYIQLLNTPIQQYLQSSGAITPEAQNVTILGGIYSMLQGYFLGAEERELSQTTMGDASLQFQGLSDDRTGLTKLMHSIPVISALYDAVRMPVNYMKGAGRTAIEGGKFAAGIGMNAWGGMKNLKDDYTRTQSALDLNFQRRQALGLHNDPEGDLRRTQAALGTGESFLGKKLASALTGMTNILDDIQSLKRGSFREGKSFIGKKLGVLGIGGKSSKLAKDASKIIDKEGFDVPYDEFVKKFHYQLPNLWERLIYFQESSYEALQNIFRSTSATVKALTGQDIEYQSSDREQKFFDFKSGEYETADDYNKSRKDAIDRIKKEAVGKQGFMSKLIFGEEYARRRQEFVEEGITDQISKRKEFNLVQSDSQAEVNTQASNITRVNFGAASSTNNISDMSCCEATASNTAQIVGLMTGTDGIMYSQPSIETSSSPNLSLVSNTRNVGRELAEIEVENKEKAEEKYRKVMINQGADIIKINKKISKNTGLIGGFKDKVGSIFGKLGGMFMSAIGMLGPMLAPLAGIAAGIAGLMAYFKFRGGDSTWTGAAISAGGAALDKIQDVGMVHNLLQKPKLAASTPWKPGQKPTSMQKGKMLFDDTKFGSALQKVKDFSPTRIISDTLKSTKVGSTITSKLNPVKSVLNPVKSVARGAMTTAGKIISKLPMGGMLRGAGRLASKYSPYMMMADAALQLRQDVIDPKRISERADSFDETMKSGGLWSKAKALGGMALNPYKAGSYVGTKIDRGIGNVTGFLSGSKYKGSGALGSMAFDAWDWMSGKKGKREKQDAETKAKMAKFRKRLDVTKVSTSGTPIDTGRETEVLETKTDIQTDVLQSGFDRLVAQGESLFSLFKKKVKSGKVSLDRAIDNNEGIIGRGADYAASKAADLVEKLPGTQKLNDAIRRAQVATGQVIGENIADYQGAIDPVKMQKLNRSTTATQLRQAGDTATEQLAIRESMKIEQRTPVSTPVGANLGVSMSKSQATKERPKNKEIEDFISVLFSNTVVVLEQSVKSFALGQTPFQILG